MSIFGILTLSPANDPIAIKDFESVSHTDYAKLRNLILSDRFFGSRSQNRCNSISNIARAFDELLIRMMYSRSLRLLRREILLFCRHPQSWSLDLFASIKSHFPLRADRHSVDELFSFTNYNRFCMLDTSCYTICMPI